MLLHICGCPLALVYRRQNVLNFLIARNFFSCWLMKRSRILWFLCVLLFQCCCLFPRQCVPSVWARVQFEHALRCTALWCTYVAYSTGIATYCAVTFIWYNTLQACNIHAHTHTHIHRSHTLECHNCLSYSISIWWQIFVTTIFTFSFFQSKFKFVPEPTRRRKRPSVVCTWRVHKRSVATFHMFIFITLEFIYSSWFRASLAVSHISTILFFIFRISISSCEESFLLPV